MVSRFEKIIICQLMGGYQSEILKSLFFVRSNGLFTSSPGNQKRVVYTRGGSSTHDVWEHPWGSHPRVCPCPFPQENTQAQEPPLQQKCVWASTVFLREGWMRPRADNAKKTHSLFNSFGHNS